MSGNSAETLKNPATETGTAKATETPQPTEQAHASKTSSGKPPKRVAIIGAGCAGLSSAYALSRSPSEFSAVVYDKAPNVGGSATSYQLPEDGDYGASFINDGVQGASPAFFNTMMMFDNVLGCKAQEVGMQISFGKGKDEFWSNVFPTELIDKFGDDIKKFGKVLKVIKAFEPIFALIPVATMLKMFRFSDGFGDRMLLPLIALFMGTGQETPHVSSAILERLFLDPSMRLFEYSQESLLASVPTMMAFPELARVYGKWKEEVGLPGNVEVKVAREVTSIVRGTKEARKRGGNIIVRSRKVDEEGKPLEGAEAAETEDVFDELIIACDADSALKMLKAGNGPTWKERKVLGNVLYKWDVTVTHTDVEYMRKHYELDYTEKYNAKRDDEESKKAFEFARKNWKPLYLIKMYEEDPSAIEMSFDLTVYQPQFTGTPPTGSGARTHPDKAPPTERQGTGGKAPREDKREAGDYSEPPLDRHVFQTIFLNREESERWTKDEIKQDKVLLTKWWKQQSHRWQHYGGTVPWMWTLNGSQHTRYAGGWTLVNCHEVGIASGFAAAYTLGAPYPFSKDKDSARLFKGYLALFYLQRARSADRGGFFA